MSKKLRRLLNLVETCYFTIVRSFLSFFLENNFCALPTQILRIMESHEKIRVGKLSANSEYIARTTKLNNVYPNEAQ